MKRLIVISISLILLFLASCNLFDPEIPQDEEIIVPLPQNLMINNVGIPDWYPSIYTKSMVEDAIFDSVFRVFKLEYNIDSTVRFDIEYHSLCSHFYNCDFWPGIQLYDSTSNEVKPENNKNFAERFSKTWWRLFSKEGFEISCIDSSSWHSNAFNRYKLYIKNQYEYPIYQHNSLLGMISLQIDSTMALRELYSNLAPHLPIPQHPVITEDSVRQATIGKEWHFHAYDGSRVDCVVDSSEIKSIILNVYIDREASVYKYKLIWCVSTSGLPVDFLFDAMTGEFIKYIQNFRT